MKAAENTYAVVKVGGKQYKVTQGETIVVDRVDTDEGKHLSLETLAVHSAGSLTTANEAKAKVKATVVEHFLGDKVHVFTYRPKKTYKKARGHRSRLSRLRIDAIEPAEHKEKKSGS